MKTDRWLSMGIAGVLAFLVALGSVGCLITAFGMTVDITILAPVWGLAAIGSAFLAGRKWGGVAILCLLTLGIGFFCVNRTAREQLNDLIRWISDFYYRGYGWHWLWHGEIEPKSLNDPLGFLGILVATQVGWSVVRREDVFSAVLAALLPVGACLVVTDTVPQVKYLYMLLLGLLLLVLTSGMRRSDEHQGNTLTLMAALPLALVLGVLFLAVPEESYVNKADAFYREIIACFPQLTDGEAGNSVTGDSREQVDLRKVGPLNRRQYAVMDVVAPVSGTMYLRGQDYDVYDGTGWSATPDRQEILYPTPDFMVSRGTVTVATLRQRDICYVPYYSGVGARLTGGAVANSGQESAYGYALRTLPTDWRWMGKVDSQDIEAVDGRYLELPADTREWAEDLVAEILPEEPSLATDKAQRIAAYVRNSADYDENTPKMPGDQDDFARWFLTESDTGYCTHFASATAVLLRAAGIPARYVTGYMFQAEVGIPVTVREDRAHAWVEYYEERLGMWMVLEATPAAESPGVTDPTQAQTTQTGETTGNTAGENGTIPDPSGGEATVPAEDTGVMGSGGKPTTQKPDPEETGEGSHTGQKTLWILLTVAAVLAVCIPGQRQLRLALRRKRAAAGSRNDRALARWRELELLYRRLGQTPPGALEELALKAVFSQHELTAEELRLLDAGLAEARNLCRKKPWYKRLVDRWVYIAY